MSYFDSALSHGIGDRLCTFDCGCCNVRDCVSPGRLLIVFLRSFLLFQLVVNSGISICGGSGQCLSARCIRVRARRAFLVSV